MLPIQVVKRRQKTRTARQQTGITSQVAPKATLMGMGYCIPDPALVRLSLLIVSGKLLYPTLAHWRKVNSVGIDLLGTPASGLEGD
jgi:hypothetical protein